MKRLFVFVPVIVALFVLNSFVLKDKEPKEKTIKEIKLTAIANIIYRSADGGQTWLNISAGLPEKLQREGVWGSGLFADGRGVYLRAGNGIYHTEPNTATPFWIRETFPGSQRNIIPGKNGILAYDLRGQFLKQINGTNKWLPMYTNFQEQAVRLDQTKDWMYKNYKEREVRTVFETVAGTVLIGSSNSLFRTANGGKTWTRVLVGDGRMKMVESDGVLLTTSKDGIFRSEDEGASWTRVISEGGLGVAVETIKGGFAAIVYNPINQTNSMHISLDGGKTWNAIGRQLQPSWSDLFMKKIGFFNSTPQILSIKQMGKNLICGRTDGIFRSADMGKTWKKLPLPAVPNFGFNLSVSGDVMYVTPNKGC